MRETSATSSGSAHPASAVAARSCSANRPRRVRRTACHRFAQPSACGSRDREAMVRATGTPRFAQLFVADCAMSQRGFRIQRLQNTHEVITICPIGVRRGTERFVHDFRPGRKIMDGRLWFLRQKTLTLQPIWQRTRRRSMPAPSGRRDMFNPQKQKGTPINQTATNETRTWTVSLATCEPSAEPQRLQTKNNKKQGLATVNAAVSMTRR